MKGKFVHGLEGLPVSCALKLKDLTLPLHEKKSFDYKILETDEDLF